MASVPAPFLTPEQYLEIDRNSESRSEYHHGEMFPIEASTVSHGRIQGNLYSALRQRFADSNCEALMTSVRVEISQFNRYTYPDLLVACGEMKLKGKGSDILLNPGLIFEVLSNSTEGFDRGEKFSLYQSIPSLREYILVSQDRILVECYRRYNERQWLYEALKAPDSELMLESAGCAIPLHEIYSRVEFSDAAD